MKEKRQQMIKGLSVSPGIGIGKVQLITIEAIQFPKFWIADREIQQEISRFRQALKKSLQSLMRIKEKVCRFQIGDQIQILETHQMIMNDALMIQGTVDTIQREKINAEWAFDKTVQKLKSSFPEESNSYFRERYNEISHVARRILMNLSNIEKNPTTLFKKDSIIVAHDLSPAETVQMFKGMVRGFVTETGGIDSHAAIVARALEIPAIVGLDGITHRVQDGQLVLIDGSQGIVILHPTKADEEKYKKLQKKQEQSDHRLLKEARLPSVTRDGYCLEVAANMELLEELPSIKPHGAEGIGLYRTEMFYLSRPEPPTEEEEFQTYRTVLKKMSPLPTTIRTLDIGGDKIGGKDAERFESVNPALGLRAIRYCLKERDIFKRQLRAILRASHYGPAKILIPMVTNLEEIRQVKRIIQDVQEDLQARKVSFDNKIKLGIMIEIPSAALMADEFAREVDFLSIGTNDLIQYTLAVDRANEDVSYLYEPLHPAVLKLLKIICDAGKSRNIDVSLCGEMAGDPLCFMILLGLGLTQLSMNPVSIPRVKKLTRSVHFQQAREILDRALDCKTSAEVEQMIKRETSKIEGFQVLY